MRWTVLGEAAILDLMPGRYEPLGEVNERSHQ
jgi:hypothetical protein